MIQAPKLRTTLLVGLAASFSVGWVALFAFWPLGSLRIVIPHWSETTILLWDAAVSWVEPNLVTARHAEERDCGATGSLSNQLGMSARPPALMTSA